MRRTWPLLTVPLAWLFIEAAARTMAVIAGVVGLNASAVSGRWQDNICALFAWGFVLVALWAWLRFYERRSLAEILARGKGFAGGFVLGAVMIAAVAGIGVAVGGLQISGPGAWFDHLTPTWVFASVLSIAGFALQAVAREALFRGWILRTVLERWGPGLATVINVATYAGLYGMHFTPSPDAIIGFLSLVLMGVTLSLTVMRDGHIWRACGLSMAWNLMLAWGFGLNVLGEHLNVTPAVLTLSPAYEPPVWVTGGGFGPNGTLEMILVLVVGLVATLLRLRGRRRTGARYGHDHDHDDDDHYDD